MRRGYSPKSGALKTDASVDVDRGFIAHVHIAAEDAVAADADGVFAGALGSEAQDITVGITNPAVPRALSVVGSASGIEGDVVISGTNYNGQAIDETLALNGTTAKHGAKAFKTITKITLPIQTHTPVAQVETATAAGTVTTAGNAAVTVTSKLFAEAVVVTVPLEADDDASAIAAAIRTSLTADDGISEHFAVSGEATAVILTARVPAANDDTLNIAIANGTGEGASEGVTAATTSANTTAGVAPDAVNVGWNDKLGLPYLLSHNTVLKAYHDNTEESTAPTVTSDVDELEKNTIDLNTALNGKAVDVYLIV